MAIRNPFRGWLSRPKNALEDMSLEKLVARAGQGNISSSGIPVNVDNAQGLAAVGVCYRYLSDILASLPLVRFRRGSDDTLAPARDLRLYNRLSQSPNDLQTSMQWRKLLIRDLLFRGNAFVLKVPESRGSFQLVRLHPDVTVVKQNPISGEITYEHRATGGSRTYSREQIIHLWFDSDDGISGLSPIQVYRHTIGEGIALREHGTHFFKNATRLQGLLTQDAEISISPEDLKAMMADFNQMYAGTKNAHKTAALPRGFDFKPVSINLEDAQWIEARQTTAREIFGIFGVPPHKGGDLADATFSNIEHENLSAVIDSITPKCVALEQCFNKDLLGPGDLFVKFNIDGLLRGDFKSRQEGLNIQRRAGIINANEWRGLENLNPREDEGGEEYIVEQNMRPQDGTEITSSTGNTP